jgi:hypothetical protein
MNSCLVFINLSALLKFDILYMHKLLFITYCNEEAYTLDNTDQFFSTPLILLGVWKLSCIY